MSKTTNMIRAMLEDTTGELCRPVRKTQFIPQEDGSVLRRVLDEAGICLAEQRMSTAQQLALDARYGLGVSQQQFADILGISVRTLHDWEQGRREPSGAAKTLLRVTKQHPAIVQEVMQQAT